MAASQAAANDTNNSFVNLQRRYGGIIKQMAQMAADPLESAP